LEEIALHDPTVNDALQAVHSSLMEFEEHMDYTATFTFAVQNNKVVPFTALSQIKRVLSKFDRFADEKGVERKLTVEPELEGPLLPIAVYSGILLNLYSNALKAVVAPRDSYRGARTILIEAENSEKMHVVRVKDDGIGVSEDLRERIWDPLFTTTSRVDNPLGSGMGLGLALVKRLVTDLNGSIDLTDADAPYTTCFTLRLPLKPKESE